jgi:hypothetical protein
MRKIGSIFKTFFVPSFFQGSVETPWHDHLRRKTEIVLQRFPLACLLVAAFLGMAAYEIFPVNFVRPLGAFVLLSALWATAAALLRESAVVTGWRAAGLTLAGFAAIWAGFSSAAPSPLIFLIAICIALLAAPRIGTRGFAPFSSAGIEFLKILFFAALCLFLYAAFLAGTERIFAAAGIPEDGIQLRIKTLMLFFLPLVWLLAVMMLSSLPPALQSDSKVPQPLGKALGLLAAAFFFAAVVDLESTKPPVSPPTLPAISFHHSDPSASFDVSGFDIVATDICRAALPMPQQNQPGHSRHNSAAIAIGYETWRVSCGRNGMIRLENAAGAAAEINAQAQLARLAKIESGTQTEIWRELVYDGTIGVDRFKLKITAVHGNAGADAYSYTAHLIVGK